MYTKLLLFLFLAVSMLFHPQEVIAAAVQGLTLWWQFVLPALLPFFILAELLMGAGLARLLGALLEPLMRPIFRLPGAASFVIAMGYTSGFPIGAILTDRLYQQGELNKEEAEHLIAFTNNPSPGFMFGAVAAGMMQQPRLGAVIAASVYAANLAVGVLFRFLHPPQPSQPAAPLSPPLKNNFRVLSRQLRAQQVPVGQLLGNAIRVSVQTTLAVGGFIVFFAVVIRLLSLWQLFSLLGAALHGLLPFISSNGWEALLSGVVEMTLGCRNTITAFTPSAGQTGLICWLMGWSGLSILAQVAGFIGNELSVKPYVYGRLLHAFLAMGFSQCFLPLVKIPAASPPGIFLPSPFWLTWQLSFQGFLLLIVPLFCLGWLCHLRQRAR